MRSTKYVLSFALAFTAPQTAPALASDTFLREKVVCKQIQRTGTRFKTKACHTKANWEQFAEQAKRDAASFNRSGRPIDDRDRMGATYGR